MELIKGKDMQAYLKDDSVAPVTVEVVKEVGK